MGSECVRLHAYQQERIYDVLILQTSCRFDMSISKEESTFLKGWAIVLVILSHILKRYLNIESNITDFMGTGGVALFLFLSGYGLYMSYFTGGGGISRVLG